MRRDVLVLGYHAVSAGWTAPLSVTPERFEAQLSLLAGRGYRGTTFLDAIGGRATGRVVAITFDDAYRSVLELAKPLLDRFGFPATVFVPTSFPSGGALEWPGVDQWKGTEHEAELRPLTWEELGGLNDAGWEIGSHTRTHPRLTTLDDETLDRELVDSRADVEERAGCECRSLAYPYGDYDARVVSAAERAGYSAAAALPVRLGERSALAWPRVGVYHDDDLRRFREKVSPLGRRVRSLRLWEIARSRSRPRPQLRS